ncbi:MAG: helix-turn-helix domain-containing protein [Haloarculaceae archaeon]
MCDQDESLRGTSPATPEAGPGDHRASLDEPYELDVEVRLHAPDFMLVPTMTTCRDLTFQLDHQSWQTSDPDRHFVTVSGTFFEELPTVFESDPTVAEFSLVASFERERLYRIVVEDGAHGFVELFTELDAAVRRVRGRRDEWNVHAHLPSRDTLAELNDTCRAAGVSMSVTRLSRLRSLDAPDGPALTPAQRELLVTAYDCGYFETPRGISQNRLAEMFDVSTSAISQRLRTALGALTAHLIVGS